MCSVSTDFIVKFDGSKLTLFKEGTILAEYEDPDPLQGIKYIGVTSYDESGDRVPSWWKFKGEFFGIVILFCFDLYE